jgi:hypothetical protein
MFTNHVLANTKAARATSGPACRDILFSHLPFQPVQVRARMTHALLAAPARFTQRGAPMR